MRETRGGGVSAPWLTAAFRCFLGDALRFVRRFGSVLMRIVPIDPPGFLSDRTGEAGNRSGGETRVWLGGLMEKKKHLLFDSTTVPAHWTGNKQARRNVKYPEIPRAWRSRNEEDVQNTIGFTLNCYETDADTGSEKHAAFTSDTDEVWLPGGLSKSKDHQENWWCIKMTSKYSRNRVLQTETIKSMMARQRPSSLSVRVLL